MFLMEDLNNLQIYDGLAYIRIQGVASGCLYRSANDLDFLLKLSTHEDLGYRHGHHDAQY